MSSENTALVTGASSGIGLKIAQRLMGQGYKVMGIGRSFDPDIDYGFEKMVCDITDTDELLLKISKIDSVKILVNCAGVGFYGLHENIGTYDIKAMVRTDLEAPMILTAYFLPLFKRQKEGIIINISSVTAFKANTYGAAYGACKAGLSSFSASIFEEARKHNIKVIEISPDMTSTNLYRNADFIFDEDPLCHLEPQLVADAVMDAIKLSRDSCVTRLTIVPQKMRVKKEKKHESEPQ